MSILASQTSHDLVTMGIPIIEKVLRTLLVYVGLVALLRLAGKRDLAQLNSFDLVVLLLCRTSCRTPSSVRTTPSSAGSSAQRSWSPPTPSWSGSIARSRPLARVLEGTETLLVVDGKVLHDDIHKLGLREEEVVSALLRQGASTPKR